MAVNEKIGTPGVCQKVVKNSIFLDSVPKNVILPHLEWKNEKEEENNNRRVFQGLTFLFSESKSRNASK